MGSLLLTFPELPPADFRPWVDEPAAEKAGQTPDEFAAEIAQRWRDGLQASGIAPERIAELRRRAGFTIYAPGSNAGVPLDLIGSLGRRRVVGEGPGHRAAPDQPGKERHRRRGGEPAVAAGPVGDPTMPSYRSLTAVP